MAQLLKHVQTRFGDIAYTDVGSGPVALFVHGVLLNSYFWRHIISGVSDLRRCIAVDLMAHGATKISPDQDLSFASQAEMLSAFCEELNIDQVDLVGNDSGGGIAQIFAARHPSQIRTLTLTDCDTHDNWPPKAAEPLWNAVMQGQLGQLGARLLSDLDFARSAFSTAYEHPEKITAETFQTYFVPLFSDAQAIRNVERWFTTSHDCSQTVAIEPLLRQLKAPTLIVWGTDDVFFPVKWAYWLRGAIPGSRSVIEVDRAKLFFPEERPDQLIPALRNFW